MNVKSSLLIASLLAASIVAFSAEAATKRTSQPAPQLNTTTTTTTTCGPHDNPFPIPVSKVPITVVVDGSFIARFVKFFSLSSSQTAPSC